MLQFKTYNFTSEQIDLIEDYKTKWQEIALSTDKINRDRATLAIDRAYEFVGLAKPKIIFFSSPKEALDYLYQEITANWGKLDPSWGTPVTGKLTEKCLGYLRREIQPEITTRLGGNLDNALADNIALDVTSNLEINWLFTIVTANFRDLANSSANDSDNSELNKIVFQLFFDAGFMFNTYISPVFSSIANIFNSNRQQNNNAGATFSSIFTGRFGQQNDTGYELPHPEVSRFINVFIPSIMADYAYYIDYCHEVLNCDRDEQKWQIFQDLVTSCGWFFAYEKTVLMCDR